MKKKLNIYVLFGCILVIITFFIVTVRLRTNAEHIYLANKSELENAVQEILDTGKVEGIVIPGVRNISYWVGEHPIIEFTTSSFGIVPASTYQGFYYSVDGVPASFQNSGEKLRKNGHIWEWKGNGDNKGTTKNIEENWFVFKASF